MVIAMDKSEITTMTRSEKLILEKIENLERKMEAILSKALKNSTEEWSLHRTARNLRVNEDHVIKQIKNGNLKARTYKDKQNRTRFRIKVADLIEFQESKRYDHASLHAEGLESSEAIFYRLRKQIVGV